MAKVTVDAGVCGFKTVITTDCDDMQNVRLNIVSDCPHVMQGVKDLSEIDAYTELFGKKLHETSVYRALSPHLPHVTCPVCVGILKAAENAAGLALPKEAVIRFE